MQLLSEGIKSKVLWTWDEPLTPRASLYLTWVTITTTVAATIITTSITAITV